MYPDPGPVFQIPVCIYLMGYYWGYTEGHRDTDRLHWHSWHFRIREAANMTEHQFYSMTFLYKLLQNHNQKI